MNKSYVEFNSFVFLQTKKLKFWIKLGWIPVLRWEQILQLDTSGE